MGPGIKAVKKGWKGWMTAIGGVASVAVLVMTFATTDFFGTSSEPEADGEVYRFNPFVADRDDDGVDEPPDVELPKGDAIWIQFLGHNEETTQSQVVLNSPGMWPHTTEETDSAGYLAFPAAATSMLDGRPLQMYEVVARSPGDEESESSGFWGLVRGPETEVSAGEATQVPMQPASAIEVEVVDGDGNPIEGAYLRLARDSVGLVHLNYTTREDGRARFRAIPRGSYYLTLDAQGYARTTVNVEHSERLGGTMTVTMDDGSGLRLPHSWRGPPVQELARSGGASSGRSTGSSQSGAATGSGGARSAASASDQSDEQSPGSGEEEATAEPAPQMVSIEVYVAGDRGSGIEGAWIEAWAGGSRVDTGRSRGNTAEHLTVPAGVPVEIVATHAGWGEGIKALSAVDEGDDFIVTLDGELLSRTGARDRIPWIDDIEAALDVELVEDGRRLLIDLPRSGSAAADAGVQRGDSLLFVRRDGGDHLAVVERGGQIVEISVP